MKSKKEKSKSKKRSLKWFGEFLFDKLAIAILLVLVNECSTMRLERDKDKMSFISEMNKRTVENLGEIWKNVDFYDFELSLLSEKMSTLTVNRRNNLKNGFSIKSIDTEIDSLRNHQESLKYNTYKSLNESRFWISEDRFDLIESFLNASQDYWASIIKKDSVLIDIYKFKRDSLRQNIIKVKQELIIDK